MEQGGLRGQQYHRSMYIRAGTWSSLTARLEQLNSPQGYDSYAIAQRVAELFEYSQGILSIQRQGAAGKFLRLSLRFQLQSSGGTFPAVSAMETVYLDGPWVGLHLS